MLNKGKARGALVRFRAWLGSQELKVLGLYLCLQVVAIYWVSELGLGPGVVLVRNIFYFLCNTILVVYLGLVTGREKYRWYRVLALFVFVVLILGVASQVYGIGKGSGNLLTVAGDVFSLLVFGGVYALFRLVPSGEKTKTGKKKG